MALSGLPKCPPPSVPDEECAKLGRDVKADGVAAVDTATMKVVKVFEAGSDPEQFDLAADGRLVANEDWATATVLDTKTGKIRFAHPVGREPEGVRVSPDGKYTPRHQRVRQLRLDHRHENAEEEAEARRRRQAPARCRVHPTARRPSSVGRVRQRALYRIRVPEGEPVERILQLGPNERPMAVELDTKRKPSLCEHRPRREDRRCSM